MAQNINNSGRFTIGHKESVDSKIKRVAAMSAAWKKSGRYIKNIIHPKIYNCWRSFMFTAKGKKIGCSDEWKNYKTFHNDVFNTYSDGLRLTRPDKSIPFSRNNFMWTDNVSLQILRDDSVTLLYNNERNTLREWSVKLGLSYASIKNRYYKHSEYTPEEILLGKKRINRKLFSDINTLEKQKARDKASKMCSAYRIRDKKKRFVFDLSCDWLLENILYKKCVYCGSDHMVGCDRVDNNKGHTKDNVVPCCRICNTARSDIFTFDEMKILGKTISTILNNRACNYER